MTQHAELIARLEAAAEGSRELDGVLAKACGWHRVEPRFAPYRSGAWIAPDDFVGTHSDGSPILDSLHGTDMQRDPPPLSRSLDAALALAERLWPNRAMWRVGHDPDDGSFKAELVVAEKPGDPPAVRANADTPALAMCAAILRVRALEAKA